MKTAFRRARKQKSSFPYNHTKCHIDNSHIDNSHCGGYVSFRILIRHSVHFYPEEVSDSRRVPQDARKGFPVLCLINGTDSPKHTDEIQSSDSYDCIDDS